MVLGHCPIFVYMSMIRWIVFIVIYIVTTVYSLYALKTVSRFPWVHYAFLLLSFLVLGNFIYQFTWGAQGSRVLSGPKAYAFGFLLAMMLFMLVNLFFLFSEDIFRFIAAVYYRFSGKETSFTLPQRRRFLSMAALGVAAVPFGAILYGMYKGKYDYQVRNHVLEFDDLPEAFHNYRITHISDIHCGSFDDHKKVAYGIDLINKQKSDILFFTGDMVNNAATELGPWMELFSQLEAKDGKYSVLGNHDYGDYIEWDTPEAKAQNLEDLKALEKQLGFKLLLNENTYLTRGDDKIALVGVENWGKGGFKKAGDLQKAKEGVAPDDFKILLSHDPSHFAEKVIDDDYHFHLTLSGHTHGMQFGIEIPGWIKWSPIKWRYKYWAGVYEAVGQYINVNRGFGYLGYPGRVGIWPEITVITLKQKALT